MNWKLTMVTGITIYEVEYGYNTVYVGMDVHKESFTLCSCKYEDEKASH